MKTFGQRVQAAREHAHLSQSRLGKAIGGLKQPSIHAIETNPTATSSKHTLAIARITGVRHEWLETGELPMVAGGKRAVDNIQQPLTPPEIYVQQWVRDVPIVGSGACGEDGVFELNGEIADQARRFPRLKGAKNVYALYIDGDSMSPWREPGELVYVHPNQPVRVGDYVVVEMHPEKAGDTIRRAYIKRLVRRTADKTVLFQFNPPEEKTLPSKKIKTIHRIMGWSELVGI